MTYVRRLMESRPMLERVPDQSLVEENNNGPANRVQATRGKDYAFIYVSTGTPVTVHAGKITGKEFSAHWYDPRKGEATKIGNFPNEGKHQFKAPTSGYGKDWVLILDDADKKYDVDFAAQAK